ncbi:MAG: hypothetical protein IJ727_01670, partial [Treponema sp.]|nr:hypothetical protein [Treponema sp.]
MGLINIYSGISSENRTVKANGRLREVLPDYDFSRCKVIKAGKEISPDYVVKEDDVIFLRTVPGAVTTVAVIAVAVAVIAVGAGVAVGVYSYHTAKEAEEAARKASQNSKKAAQGVTQYPFIKGANNTNALGQTIQYVMGNVYNTPYKLNEGFYSIGGTDGEKQYYNVILSAGFGKQLIQSLSIGNEKIKDFSATSPQSGVYAFNSGSLYYDSENKIEIAQDSEFTQDFFKQKCIGKYSGEEIKHDHGSDAEPLIIQCAEHTMKIEVCIQFNGLRKFDDGDWKKTSVTIQPEWSNDGGAKWNPFTFDRGSNVFEYNSNHTLRFTATKKFSYAEAYGKQISVRLTRTTEKADSNSQEGCYCLYVNSFCYDNK